MDNQSIFCPAQPDSSLCNAITCLKHRLLTFPSAIIYDWKKRINIFNHNSFRVRFYKAWLYNSGCFQSWYLKKFPKCTRRNKLTRGWTQLGFGLGLYLWCSGKQKHYTLCSTKTGICWNQDGNTILCYILV